MTTSNQPRQRKTDQQRAQEALGVAQRRVNRIARALTHQKELVTAYERDLEEAELRLEYVQKDPALNPSGDTNQEGTTA